MPGSEEADPLLAVSGKAERGTVEDVPGVGTVHVRGLFADEYEAVELLVSQRKPDGPTRGQSERAAFLRYGVTRPDGSPLYAADDLPALGRLPIQVSGPIFVRIQQLSGLRADGGNG